MFLFACGSAEEESQPESGAGITASVPPVSSAPETTVKLVKITADSLNIRSEASTDSDILGAVSGGEYLLLVKENAADEWHQVKYNGVDAYVFAEYTEISELPESEADALLNGDSEESSKENGELSAESAESSAEESSEASAPEGIESTAEAESSAEESSGVTAENTRRDEDGEIR